MKGKTVHLLKQGAKPVARSKKRKRFEVFDPTGNPKEDAVMKATSALVEQTLQYTDVTSQLRQSKRNKTPSIEANMRRDKVD